MWRFLRPRDNQLGIRASRLATHWVWLITAPLGVLFVGLPAWCILRLRYPSRRIRVRRLPSERLGHFVAETDLAVSTYLARGGPGPGMIEVYYFSDAVAPNTLVARQARKHLLIIPTYVGWALDAADRLLDWRNARKVETPIHGRPDLHFMSVSNSWMEFESSSVSGRAELQRHLRFSCAAPVVPIFLRDEYYEASIGLANGASQHQHRSSPRQDFSLAVDRLCRSGLTPVLMGRTDPASISANKVSCEVDYSSSTAVSPVADLYLVSDCSFALASDSGSMFLPLLFRRPTALVNMGSLFGLPRRGPIAMVCLKHFLDADSGRELTFAELVDRGVSHMSLTSELDAARIRVVNCSPEEIEAVVIDMLALTQGPEPAEVGSPQWNERQDEVTVPLYGDDWPRASKSWSLLRPNFLEP